MTQIFRTIIFLIATVLIATPLLAQSDTVFSYQGELKQHGNPVNGLFNFEFKLTNETGTASFGTINTLNDVPVVDGKFMVELDFGANGFYGTASGVDRWLEISVNGSQLVPRQHLTHAPYANQTRGMHVGDSGGITIFANDLNAFGVSTTLRIWHDGGTDGFLSFQNINDTHAQIQKRTQYDYALLDIDPIPLDGSSDATLRLFRNTDTTGLKRVLFYRGNDTTTTSAGIGLDGADSYFQIQGGNVGIGTADPRQPYKLDVIGGRGDQDAAVHGSAEGFGVIGSAETAGVLGVTGTGKGVHGFSSSSSGGYGVYGVSLSSNGFDFYAAGAGQDYGSSSSRRWKSNIVAIDQPLEKISQLEGVYFDWDKAHGGHHDVGMIAEDVGAVLPEIVQYEANGIDALGMDYSKITPLLVEAVKALRQEKDAEIGELKQQIQDLQRLVERLTTTKENAK